MFQASMTSCRASCCALFQTWMDKRLKAVDDQKNRMKTILGSEGVTDMLQHARKERIIDMKDKGELILKLERDEVLNLHNSMKMMRGLDRSADTTVGT